MLVSLLSHTLPIAAVKQQTTNAFTNGHKKFEHVAITGLAPSSSHHEFGTFIHIAIRRARPESYSTTSAYSVLSMADCCTSILSKACEARLVQLESGLDGVVSESRKCHLLSSRREFPWLVSHVAVQQLTNRSVVFLVRMRPPGR